MKRIFLLCSMWFVLAASFAQTGLKYGVKIKPGNALQALPDNNHVAIASGKDLVIVNVTSGIVNQTLEGHGGLITGLDVSKEGNLILSSSSDKSIILWDIISGTKNKTFTGHDKSIEECGFINSSKFISLDKGGTAKIWDVETGKELIFPEQKQSYKSLAACQDFIALIADDGQVYLHSSEDHRVVNTINDVQDATSLAFDLTGKKLFIGQGNGQIRVWNIIDSEWSGNLNNGKGSINDINLTFDNQHLLVSGETCRIYSLKSMELVKEIDQVSSSVLGATVSPDGQNLIYLEEFASKAKIWDVSDVNIAYAVKLKDEDDKIPPQIYVSSPAKILNHRVVHYQDMISIKGSVIDDSGVRSLKINGINTPVKQNGNYVIRLPLAMGDNFVTMEVVDVNDNTAIKKFVVTRKNMDGEEYDPSQAKNYLLVIGINKYEHWPQLYNAVKDANDVVSTLMGMYNFEFSNVKLITDEMATRANIYKTLREYVNLVGPKDNFMIYYSGHGHFDELLNEGYWVPVDARLNSNGDYLSNSDISKIIGNVNSQHTFLVADACYSGSLFNEQSRGYAENVEKFKSRWGLASGRLETVSDGALGMNSPFARNFINYLKSNEKEKVTVSEIVQYVKVQVSEVSDQTPIGNPLKGVGDEGGEFIFYKKD